MGVINIGHHNFWIIYNYFEFVIYFLILKVDMDLTEDRKKSRAFGWISIFVITFLLQYLLYEYLNQNSFVFLINTAIYMIYAIINYGTPKKRLFIKTISFFAIVELLIEKISYILAVDINVIVENGIVVNTRATWLTNYESLVISILITVFSVIIYEYIINARKNDEKISISIVLLLILNTFIIIAIFKMISVVIMGVGNHIYYGILIILMILVSDIFIIMTMKSIVKDYKIKNENKILRESVDKEVKNYIASSRENQKVREMYHDIKNHIICIDELYKSGNSELAGEYIQKIEGSLKKYESVRNEFNTGHIISDSILKNKKSMCDEYGINFECKVDFSRYDFLDMADFCTILSNLLDNAIEACLHVEHSDRYIKISNSIVNNFSILIVENSKENEIKKDGSKILTSKKDKSIHGIGIDNVRSCVEKYNGDMKIDYDESSFKVRIMIPIAV